MKAQICSYISKYLTDYGIGVGGFSFDELVARIYAEMAEFSFLAGHLYNNSVEEIDTNSWKDVKTSNTDGKILPASEHFSSPQQAIDVIRRVPHQSGMILDHSQPVVRWRLYPGPPKSPILAFWCGNKIRIANTLTQELQASRCILSIL